MSDELLNCLECKVGQQAASDRLLMDVVCQIDTKPDVHTPHALGKAFKLLHYVVGRLKEVGISANLHYVGNVVEENSQLGMVYVSHESERRESGFRESGRSLGDKQGTITYVIGHIACEFDPERKKQDLLELERFCNGLKNEAQELRGGQDVTR